MSTYQDLMILQFIDVYVHHRPQRDPQRRIKFMPKSMRYLQLFKASMLKYNASSDINMLSILTELFSNVSNGSNGSIGAGVSSQPAAVSILYSGVESFLFPFLLVFAIVYGVLERSKMFEGKKDIDSIIAFVLGIVFATTSYTLNLAYIILPIVGVIAIIIFMLLVLASMVYGDTASPEFPKSGKKIIVVLATAISIILIFWILLGSNFGFVGLTQAALVNGLYSYGPYIAVLIFLIVAGYLLSR